MESLIVNNAKHPRHTCPPFHPRNHPSHLPKATGPITFRHHACQMFRTATTHTHRLNKRHVSPHQNAQKKPPDANRPAVWAYNRIATLSCTFCWEGGKERTMGKCSLIHYIHVLNIAPGVHGPLPPPLPCAAAPSGVWTRPTGEFPHMGLPARRGR